MNIYLLLHLTAILSLISCLVALCCMGSYFSQLRYDSPLRGSQLAAANLYRTLASCTRYCCLTALADMLSCGVLWLLASPYAEIQALRQLFIFANGALIGGAVLCIARVFAANALRNEREQRRLLRPVTSLTVSLWMLGMLSLAAITFINC